MIKFFKRAWMGAGYLEGYGHHPGWLMLCIFIVASGLAGVDKGGMRGFIGGALFAAVFFGAFFISGCVRRAKGYEKDMEQTFKILQEQNGV